MTQLFIELESIGYTYFLTQGAPGFSGPCPFRRRPRKSAADNLPMVLFQLACMLMAALMSQESSAEAVLAGWSDEPNDGNMVIILWLYGNINSLVDWVSMGKLYCIILHPLWGMINVFFKMWWDMAMGMTPISYPYPSIIISHQGYTPI